MYSVILAALITTGTEQTQAGICHGCHGCCGCSCLLVLLGRVRRLRLLAELLVLRLRVLRRLRLLMLWMLLLRLLVLRSGSLDRRILALVHRLLRLVVLRICRHRLDLLRWTGLPRRRLLRRCDATAAPAPRLRFRPLARPLRRPRRRSGAWLAPPAAPTVGQRLQTVATRVAHAPLPGEGRREHSRGREAVGREGRLPAEGRDAVVQHRGPRAGQPLLLQSDSRIGPGNARVAPHRTVAGSNDGSRLPRRRRACNADGSVDQRAGEAVERRDTQRLANPRHRRRLRVRARLAVFQLVTRTASPHIRRPGPSRPSHPPTSHIRSGSPSSVGRAAAASPSRSPPERRRTC